MMNACHRSLATSCAYHDAKKRLFLYRFYDRAWTGLYPSNGFPFLNGWVKTFTDGLDTKRWGMYVNHADPRMNQTEAQDVYYRKSLRRLR